MSVHEILSLIACASTQISLRIFKFSPDLFGCSHTLQSMDVDKDKTKLRPLAGYVSISVLRRPLRYVPVYTSCTNTYIHVNK